MSNLRSLTFDAIIIGGGGAGLRAAFELGEVRQTNSRPFQSLPDTLSHCLCPGRYYLRYRVF